MSVADICLLASVLVVVVVIAKMLRAIRLLDGRVTILQEQLKFGRANAGKPAARPAMPTPVPSPPSGSGRTPVAGVPAYPPAHRTPAPVTAAADEAEEGAFPGEAKAHHIDQAEADAVWARMEAEQERLHKAMGRDFQVRKSTMAVAAPAPDPKRSAVDVRGARPPRHALSSQELARKLERK
jgi:hypothetical protein